MLEYRKEIERKLEKMGKMSELVLIDYDGEKKVLCPSRVVSVVVNCSKLNFSCYLPEGDVVVINRKHYSHLLKVLNQLESWGLNCPVNFQ